MTGEPRGGEADALLARLWAILQRWAVPVMMSLAYMLLAATSDTNLAGKSWMAVGFAFVMVVWFVFRTLTETAALARALGVGDVARLRELADRHLARKRRPADRAPFLVGRALADLLAGDPAAALDAVALAAPGSELAPLAAAVRVAALVELGHPADEARAALVAAPGAPALRWLAEGMIAWRADQLDEASPLFARVLEDIRTGSVTRAIAHRYAARIAEARGDATAAARHRREAALLATPEATWLKAS